MKRFKDLVTYDPVIEDDIVEDIIKCIKNSKENDMWCKEAPAGFGKTTLAFKKLAPTVYHRLNTRVFLLIGPQSSNVEDSTIVTHIRNLQMNNRNILIEHHLKAKPKKLSGYLDFVLDTDGLLILTMTDSSYRDNDDFIIQTIKTAGLQDKTLLICDEGDIGSTSRAEAARWNTGVKSKFPPNFRGKKYKAMAKSSGPFQGVVSFSATFTDEQRGALKLIPNLGFQIKSNYKMVGEHPSKEEIILRTAAFNPIHWYDAEYVYPPEELLDFFARNLTDQSRQNDLAKQHNLPKEVNPKRVGIVKLETKYLDKEKRDAKRIIRNLEDQLYPFSWNFSVAFLYDDKIETYMTYNGDFKKTEHNYNNDSELYKALRSNNDLRFLFVVDKGSRGIDIPNVYDIHSCRTYGMFNPAKEPVTATGVQYCLRANRNKVRIEDLIPHFKDPKELINYFQLVNTFNLSLPESEYWRGVESFLEKKYNTSIELKDYLHSL